MRGYVIINRRNKEGSIFVPEVGMQFKACPGGRRGWLNVYFTDGMHYELEDILATIDSDERPKPKMTKVEWLKQNFDFAMEIDVPLLMIRFAIETDEKKNRQIEAFGSLFKGMFKQKAVSLDLRKDDDFKVMEKGVHRVKEIMDLKESGEISDAKKYAIALQIQRWVHEAGGLC